MGFRSVHKSMNVNDLEQPNHTAYMQSMLTITVHVSLTNLLVSWDVLCTRGADRQQSRNQNGLMALCLSSIYVIQGWRGYEIPHPYPYPQIFRGYPWIYIYRHRCVSCIANKK